MLKKNPALAKPPAAAPEKDRPAYYVGGKAVSPKPEESVPEQKNYDRIVGIAKSSVNGEPVRKSLNVVPLALIEEEKAKKKPSAPSPTARPKPQSSSNNLNKDYNDNIQN